MGHARTELKISEFTNKIFIVRILYKTWVRPFMNRNVLRSSPVIVAVVVAGTTVSVAIAGIPISVVVPAIVVSVRISAVAVTVADSGIAVAIPVAAAHSQEHGKQCRCTKCTPAQNAAVTS
jgi:hypothetical protein